MPATAATGRSGPPHPTFEPTGEPLFSVTRLVCFILPDRLGGTSCEQGIRRRTGGEQPSREDSFILSEKRHSPTPVCEWQQTELQPTHRRLSPTSALAEARTSSIRQDSATNGHLTIGLRLLTIRRLAPIDELSIDPVFRQTLPQECQ